MGQNSSRQHHQPEPTPTPGPSNPSHTDNRPSSSSNTSSLSFDSPISNLTPQAGPSHRSSIRRSILNLINPSVRGRANSNTGSPRKSWRQLRRWSKVPPDLDETLVSSGTIEAPVEPPSSVIEKGKGVERQPESSFAESPNDTGDSQSASAPNILPDNSEGITELHRGTIHDGGAGEEKEVVLQDVLLEGNGDQGEVVNTTDPVSNQPQALESSPTSQASTSTELPVETSQELPADDRAQTAPQPPTPGRQFPPPGTLVVVQGVVHTTDVPRPPPPSNIQAETPSPAPMPRASSMPPNSSNESTRNRLSTLLRTRPAGPIASRPSSAVGAPSSSNQNTSLTLDSTSEILPSDTVRSHTAPPTEIFDSENASLPIESSPHDTQSGTISSSSIDVLGTLLSVAAAATAASLLTGTTEHMLPPNFGPPSYNSNGPSMRPASHSPPIPESWASRPTSPTPTAGLGTGIGVDPAAAGRSERLRHAWGSIRERLGLRPTSQSTAASPLGNSSEPASGLASSDPRELVLAQMARAFNLGFGLGDTSTTPAHREGEQLELHEPNRIGGETSAQPTINEGNPQLPPDGGFERFLVDLQADLRTALMNSNTLSDRVGSTELSSVPVPEESSSTLHDFATPTVDDSNVNASDSESEYQDAHETGQDGDGDTISATPDSVPLYDDLQPASENSNAPTMSPGLENGGTGRVGEDQDTDVQGRINWWRLYRFPPITTSLIPGPPGMPTTRVTSPLPSASSSATSPEPTSPLDADPTLSELPFANVDVEGGETNPRAHTVVPVIVVGLQSVSTNWQQPSNMENSDIDPFGGSEDFGSDEVGDTATLNDSRSRVDESDDTRRSSSARGRAWHSRAADAFRNLRPNRRNRAAPATAATGSRTFLIYVIGGYYPPDHSIVTGGPNTLDSFEALLELAELLGQVKPPTVSKEDIEKSGLEIIKASQLEKYEREQKVSSNCTERCLVCLDDYQPEENVRVMRCRHAFHKACVDKWLETGRNNCPACRSRGVHLNSTET